MHTVLQIDIQSQSLFAYQQKKKERHTWEINRKSIFSFFSKNLNWLTDAETLKSVVLDSFEQLNLAESATSEISLQVTVHGNGTDAFVFCFLALNTSERWVFSAHIHMGRTDKVCICNLQRTIRSLKDEESLRSFVQHQNMNYLQWKILPLKKF